MTNKEAIRLIRNLPTMCEFTDAYGEPIDSDVYYKAVDMAISALQTQDVNDKNTEDTISRRNVIDELKRYFHDEYYQRTSIQDCINCFIEDILTKLPSAHPEYEPVKAVDFAKTMSENMLYSFMAWYGEVLELIERQGFVICKKTL